MIETILVWFLGIFGTLATIFLFYEFVRFAFLVIRDDICAMRNRKNRRTE